MESLLGKSISIRVRVWIDSDNKPLLGWGRVKLLEEIRKTGSISKAAKTLEMSYRQAWEHVKNMNENAREPFVIAISGGKNGGGAQVTPFGLKAIAAFKKLEKAINSYAKSL